MVPAIEPVTADDGATMDAWYALTMRCHAHDAPELAALGRLRQLAEHRGRRLGLRVKLANLELLAREHPQVRAVDTYNADDNRWMIAVNEAMGFVPVRRVEDWELDL